MLLKDKIAIITGAGKGIGLGIAKCFSVEEGAIVIIAEQNEITGGPQLLKYKRRVARRCMLVVMLQRQGA